jgi:hypothetical protein
MYFIHLKSYHIKCVRFSHPLLDSCDEFTEDELNKLAEHVLAGGDPDELILALRARLSIIVGRYLGNWPMCRPFVDDMVSEGLASITKLCHAIPEDVFAEQSIPYIAQSWCTRDIERMLNAMRSLSAPAASTQFTRIKDKKDPVYLMSASQLVSDEEAEEMEDYTEDQQPRTASDVSVRDIFDAVCKIVPSDEFDAYLLDEESWGRQNVELAAEVGVTASAVRYRREKLYKKFLELTE